MLDSLDKNQRCSWMHAALVLSKLIPIGSPSANNTLRDKLLSAGSMENLYEQSLGMFPIDDTISKSLDKIYTKGNIAFEAIVVNDTRYPDKLRNVDGAPPIIYCRGDLNLLHVEKSIAFVGTRELFSPEHIAQGESAIKRMINAGFNVIVSGLASGSDTLGHKTAIHFGGRTIAVLGTPLDTYYPKENKALQDEIGNKHLLVSEYPIGIRAYGSFFANRNRTTVGLSSEGVVVARAGDRSGTQHAIRNCIEQSKQLYVLENNIYEPSYEWIKKYNTKIKVVKNI